MDERPALHGSVEQRRNKPIPMTPSKYGVRWLQPSQVSRHIAHGETSGIIQNDRLCESLKGVAKPIENEEYHDGNYQVDTRRTEWDGQFYDHFQEPCTGQAKVDPLSLTRRKIGQHEYHPSTQDTNNGTGFMFNRSKPTKSRTANNKLEKHEVHVSNETEKMPSRNSFFDLVKEYKNDMKDDDQRIPASKTLVNVLGTGFIALKGLGEYVLPKHETSRQGNLQEDARFFEGRCSALKCLSSGRDNHRRSFAHFDWQSMTFSFSDVLPATEIAKRKNGMTGATKAAVITAQMKSTENSPFGSLENLDGPRTENESIKENDVLGWSPCFCNEIGGDETTCSEFIQQTAFSETHMASVQLSMHENNNHSITDSPTTANVLLVNHEGISVLEKSSIDNDKCLNGIGFVQEYVDAGALYYRSHFYHQDHQNFFGIDEKHGPVAISLKRDKINEQDSNVKENLWHYRVIVRTSELCTLRGSVLEDVILLQNQATTRSLKARDVLEYVCPEINLNCLKIAPHTETVQKQLLKVDEQNVTDTYKVGVMYCKRGQTTEEEMYNNEFGSPALEEFLDLIGEKVQLKGFNEFRGGLDVKTNSTGKESYFTTFQGAQIMFHVSTLLPYTANNVQQLLRKRHIGNDIVTIVFQEPGASPFCPLNVRSHFQHLFFVVRVYQPCSSKTSYRIAVARYHDIPAFGPLIPRDAPFQKSSTFREFLLTKLLNGERAARCAGKFKAMSMNTRQEYLRDLALNHSTINNLDASQKFLRFSLTAASRRIKDKERGRNQPYPEEKLPGGLVWHVIFQKLGSETIHCMLGISDYVFLLVCNSTNKVIFSIPCQAIIGWATGPSGTLQIYYGRGERITLKAHSCDECDWQGEVTRRLEIFSGGCEAKIKTLKRNVSGQLGFHVNYEGIVMDVEQSGLACQLGILRGCRLVEICKVLVVTMTHEETLDLLRTSDVVTVVMIPPMESGVPRRCSKSLYHVSPVLKVAELDSDVACEVDRGIIKGYSDFNGNQASRTKGCGLRFQRIQREASNGTQQIRISKEPGQIPEHLSNRQLKETPMMKNVNSLHPVSNQRSQKDQLSKSSYKPSQQEPSSGLRSKAHSKQSEGLPFHANIAGKRRTSQEGVLNADSQRQSALTRLFPESKLIQQSSTLSTRRVRNKRDHTYPSGMTRAKSDESIQCTTQMSRWKDVDTKGKRCIGNFGNTAPSNLTDEWDQLVSVAHDSQESSLSCAVLCPSWNKSDHAICSCISQNSSFKRPHFRCGCQLYPMEVPSISTTSDADVRLKKIENDLKSLQTQITEERYAKRKIFEEVEELNGYRRKLQQQAVTCQGSELQST